MKKTLLTLLTIALFINAKSQVVPISISSSTALYEQNFDSLENGSASTYTFLPQGWMIAETGTQANNQYRAGTGSLNTGDIYSLGASGSTERALGGLQSGNLVPYIAVAFVNNTTAALTQVSVEYTLELWRYGGRTNVVADSLYVSYAINNSAITATSGWTRVDALCAGSPQIGGSLTGATRDGNLSSNQVNVRANITGINVAVNDTFYLRFVDYNVASSDDALGIDNFYFTVSGVLPVQYSSLKATRTQTGNEINWSTASEKNNSHFLVERSINNSNFEMVGKVIGSGNSNVIKSYSYTDITSVIGNVCYRLKQVDFNGESELSKVVCVNNSKQDAQIVTTPNPFNNQLVITVSGTQNTDTKVEIIDLLGKVHYATVNNTQTNELVVNTTSLPNGIYFVKVTNGTEVTTQRIIKK
jgi:hypothetical protein